MCIFVYALIAFFNVYLLQALSPAESLTLRRPKSAEVVPGTGIGPACRCRSSVLPGRRGSPFRVWGLGFSVGACRTYRVYRAYRV